MARIGPAVRFPISPRLHAAGLAVLVALAVLSGLGRPAFAELTFPPLTGRVVDAAQVLDPATRAALDEKLAAQEAKATDQFVVATVPSLEGTSVEDYANRLFRFWKLGQEKKNNGVLLLVAPAERKVRIEVGYGLEGILTDAVASTIIRNAVVPAFKAGDMAGGIVKGAEAVIEVLNLDPDEARARARRLEQSGEGGEDWVPLIIFIVLVLFWIVVVMRARGGGPGAGAARRRGAAAGAGSAAGWSWGSSGGGSSDGGFSGGFSGGGGSSGGGGASGDW